MKPFLSLWGSLCLAVCAQRALADSCHETSWDVSDHIIMRDVAIIGGGASGTYAAINLKDRGKSVVVVEKTGRMGGNAVTYEDPDTGTFVNYGVQLYDNSSIVRNFFNRLQTPLADLSFSTFGEPVYADFEEGILLNLTQGMLGNDYFRELNKYPYLEDGIRLPDPVPKDLLLPWSQYLKKYNITYSAAATLARPAVAGRLLNILSLYVFNNLNHLLLREMRGSAVVNANHNNAELYQNALRDLGNDVLLHSTVIAGHRGTHKNEGVRLIVETPTGRKLIIAKQLLVGMPPVVDNMKFFGLDPHERDVLSQLYGLPYYGGVVKNTGLEAGFSYRNYDDDTPYNLAEIPGVVTFNPTPVDGLFYYWYSSPHTVSQEYIERDARDAIKTLQRLTHAPTQPEPDFVAFQDFAPYQLRANAKSIRNGFYDDMYDLQGYRNTWYIGSLFVTGSSQVWVNLAKMLPDIIAAVDENPAGNCSAGPL